VGLRAGPFGFTRVVFLSHVLTAGGPTFPGDPPGYLNADAAGRLHYPGFGAEAARWLIEERSIGAGLVSSGWPLLWRHRPGP
jgi:kynurenine formamidase